VFVGDFLDDGVEVLDVPDVDAVVGEGGAEFFDGAFLDAGEVGGGGFETVEGVDSGFVSFTISFKSRNSEG
jgi:hypothetical protein